MTEKAGVTSAAAATQTIGEKIAEKWFNEVENFSINRSHALAALIDRELSEVVDASGTQDLEDK